VNWFRTNNEGKFLWPGFGDNFRVLEWILKRCEGEVEANETAIGFVPKAEDINLEELDYTIQEGVKFDREILKDILSVDKEAWQEDAAGIKEFYGTIGDRLPAALQAELDRLCDNLSK
jgi:phosphoenolpyruvate carboxykinase (GTP)